MPTASFSTRPVSPGLSIATVSSPRFEVKTISGASVASAPATAVSPGIDPTYRSVARSTMPTRSSMPSATGELGHEALDSRHDAVSRRRIALADGGHVVPTLGRGGFRAHVAAERHHPGGGAQVVGRV